MNDGGRLCLACGLCCSGQLFAYVRLTPGEAPRMTRLGLPIFEREDCSALSQPCAALEGYACRIYDERPMRCDAFRCTLLEAHQADEVGLEEALGVVARAAELHGAQREQYIDRHFLGRSRPRAGH